MGERGGRRRREGGVEEEGGQEECVVTRKVLRWREGGDGNGLEEHDGFYALFALQLLLTRSGGSRSEGVFIFFPFGFSPD